MSGKEQRVPEEWDEPLAPSDYPWGDAKSDAASIPEQPPRATLEDLFYTQGEIEAYREGYIDALRRALTLDHDEIQELLDAD